MRYRIAALAAVLAGALVSAAQDAPYVSKEGGYVARFPAGADVTTKTVPAPGGLKAVVTTAVVKAERQTYIVTYTVHQKGVLKAPARTILDLGEKATLAQPQTLRLTVKDLTAGKEKYPAREILSERDGNQTRTRFIAADPVLYTLVVGGPMEFASSKDATDFLDTFEIVPPGKVKAKK
jgi:hypothetical protein